VTDRIVEDYQSFGLGCLILDLKQVKTAGRRSAPGMGSVARGEQVPKFRRRAQAPPDLDERPDDIADHVA
jgi:hypothetical protein